MTRTMTPRRLAALIAAAGTLGLSAQAPAAEHAHEHAQATAKPLPPGKRWPTDAPLREGMTKIRAAIEPQLKAVHAGQLPAERYKAIAGQAESQVAYIVGHCKLQPEADAALHGILAQLNEGIEAMSGKPGLPPSDGAARLVAALNDYGQTFDHPGWKPLRH